MILSFDKKVHYYTRWSNVFQALLVPLLIFITWDSLVTGRHWWFNELYVTNIRILKLPPGEWLFFISVPFSTLFIWDVLHTYFNKTYVKNSTFQIYLSVLFFSISIPLALIGKEYTALVCFIFSMVLMLDKLLRTQVLSRSLAFSYILIIFLLMFIFNGYLTSRPVVMYDLQYQLNCKIYTIPIEDFLYGFSHLLLCTIIYEKITMRSHE